MHKVKLQILIWLFFMGLCFPMAAQNDFWRLDYNLRKNIRKRVGSNNELKITVFDTNCWSRHIFGTILVEDGSVPWPAKHLRNALMPLIVKEMVLKKQIDLDQRYRGYFGKEFKIKNRGLKEESLYNIFEFNSIMAKTTYFQETEINTINQLKPLFLNKDIKGENRKGSFSIENYKSLISIILSREFKKGYDLLTKGFLDRRFNGVEFRTNKYGQEEAIFQKEQYYALIRQLMDSYKWYFNYFLMGDKGTFENGMLQFVRLFGWEVYGFDELILVHCNFDHGAFKTKCGLNWHNSRMFLVGSNGQGMADDIVWSMVCSDFKPFPDANIINDYVGEYEFANFDKLTVFKEGGSLMVFYGGKTLKLFHCGKDQFLANGNQSFSFEREGGKIIKLANGQRNAVKIR